MSIFESFNHDPMVPRAGDIVSVAVNCAEKELLDGRQ